MTIFLWSFLGFLMAITLLVTVHEWGHFLVARLLGIQVLRFSVGFGKPIYSFFDKKGTEYAIGWLPVGGYVKFLENHSHDKKEGTPLAGAFETASIPRRMSVILAGPFFNFLFAIFAYALMFVVGVKTLAPVIGTVSPASIAEKAQLKPLEEITFVDEVPTSSWESVTLRLLPYIGTEKTLTLKTRSADPKKPQEEYEHSLDLKGWSYDGEDPAELLQSLGLIPYVPSLPASISKVIPQGPAEEGGLLPHDVILAVNQHPVKDWKGLIDQLSLEKNKTVKLTLLRQGKEQVRFVKLGIRKDSEGKPIPYLGILSTTVSWPKEWIREEKDSFPTALWHGVKKTWQISALTCKMLAKIVKGEISTQSLSGPIGIAEGAGVSLSLGFSDYLNFLALVSVSLGIMNLLPIPLLDGGQLLFCFFESITKKPLSRKAQEIGLVLGILLLGSLFLLAIYNDVTRL